MLTDGLSWGTVPQGISAVAALCGLWIAGSASRAWKRTLAQRRRDDLLAAIFDLAGTVGRLMSAVERSVGRLRYGENIDALYACLLSLEKAYVIAVPSFGLDEKRLSALRDKVYEMHESLPRVHDNMGAMTDEGRASALEGFRVIQPDIEALRAYIRSKVD